eukprot:CAMPEP_0185203380 /NCGR_PEP_ID=MMETSP1140-20130426/52918_1 /TAXON_ID=298111 /ORGANISM="Pavlova sp., Strain CCMP459" /LENGTH=48 /DNA_ID= /DNA_START= /DNA_END= /DNA_ORIENTATION=
MSSLCVHGSSRCFPRQEVLWQRAEGGRLLDSASLRYIGTCITCVIRIR